MFCIFKDVFDWIAIFNDGIAFELQVLLAAHTGLGGVTKSDLSCSHLSVEPAQVSEIAEAVRYFQSS